MLDLGYLAEVGRLFRILGEVDYLDIEITTLPEDYKKRAARLTDIKNIEVYILSREDIIVTKIGRYSDKDKEDIKEII